MPADPPEVAKLYQICGPGRRNRYQSKRGEKKEKGGKGRTVLSPLLVWFKRVESSRLFVHVWGGYYRRSMSKRTRRAPRRRPASGLARKPRSSRLLDRILSAPNLARVVPRLPPEVLHRVVQHYGLEECGELLVLATPDQLTHVFDRDLWRAPRAASFEQLDADRFGLWVEVLVQADAIAAAILVAGMDVDLMATALAQHIRVFDHSAVAWYPTLDGELASSTPFLDLDERVDVGGYVVLPKREGPQDAIVALLTALDEGHHDYFSRLMSGCVRLSHSTSEIDGLDDLMTVRDQAMFDSADAREQRLGAQGYVAPAQARAFLEMARRVDLRSGTACRSSRRTAASAPRDVSSSTASR